MDPESSESDSLGSKTRRATLQRILNDQGLGHVAKRLGPNNNNLADAKKVCLILYVYFGNRN